MSLKPAPRPGLHMASPFPASSSTPGTGRIVVGISPNGEPSVEILSYQYPLKLLSPSSGGGGSSDSPKRKSALVFLLSYGGGLVAGDQVNLAVEMRPHARLSLVTQGTTKVFKAPPVQPSGSMADLVVTRQNLEMRVAAGAALCLLPDPVQPFADSVYEQLQVVRLAAGSRDGTEAASLCLLDWVTQGRAARGENWSFTRWQGRNEIWVEEQLDDASISKSRLLVRDAVILVPEMIDGGLSALAPASDYAFPRSTVLRDSMHGLAVVGTLILRGPLVEALGRFFLAEFAAQPRLGARDFHESSGPGPALEPAVWRASRLQLELTHGVLWSAAAVRSCVVVKFGARSVEGGRLWIGGMLQREGSVAAVFGDQALMCVR
ncbi:urease accessory protein [Grosmannia clavigera kw1407]|uniref:Urease accessory protein n=1 Tax=Grosmannia clavigera (strain kw1407 / UAMH 11150) TaxID=655863 RepID=F0XLM1_GROCL|nr:urease accessory protein [Grosmannia clavigera kw1407]EFX01009.1 urease accessory protein [Grosmannia clavigera kw1407]